MQKLKILIVSIESVKWFIGPRATPTSKIPFSYNHDDLSTIIDT